MQDGVIPLFSRDRTPKIERKGGWSNQDLAELYRIEAALVQSGIMVDTELGETDEGDPWFAFCRTDTGEVLVHVAIIDGEYHIAGATSSVIVKGYSFTDIVRQFMTREPAFLLGTARHNNVVIHPSSVLVAVFAAICLISEEHTQDLLALSGQEKIALGDGNRLDPETFHVADQRHITLGDYTFSPQQVFIILSAIAFSASPIVQNNGIGLEAAMGVFDLIENGSHELEHTVETFVADLWQEGFEAFDPKNDASREYAQTLSADQLERVAANAEAAESTFEAEQPEAAYPDGGESERIDAASRSGSEADAGVFDQPADVEQELVVKTGQGSDPEVAIVSFIMPETAYEFFEINAVITEANEEVVFMIDTIDGQLDNDVQLDSDVIDTGFDNTFVDARADTISPTTIDYQLADYSELNLGTISTGSTPAVATPTPVPQTEAWEDSGFKTGAMSEATYQEVSYYFDLFTERFGEAQATFNHGRWLVKNDAADDYGWYTDRSNPITHTVYLDDGTKVFFMGIHSEPGYYDTIA